MSAGNLPARAGAEAGVGAGIDAIPAELRAAFDAYEAAIVANDVEVLDAAFAPGPATLRADSAGLLVGHEAIGAFRGTRKPVAPRKIEKIEYRELGPDTALIVSVSRYHGGGTGVQTQIWQHIHGRWLITAAHVTPRAAALDRSVWRSVGEPLMHGEPRGPLCGLAVAVKDLFAIAGHRIGAGNLTYLREAVPESTTALAAVDLLRGGADLRGIARSDEFAYSVAGDNVHYGTPPNGAVPGALPGGSSSGPASAVAMGQADIGLATDTAGSIRVPASYQGLWGLRTSHDLVPRNGMLPLAQSFDTVGWIARDGETLQRVVDWCLGSGGTAASGSDESGMESESAGHARGASGADLPWRFSVASEALEACAPETVGAFEALLAQLRGIARPPVIAEVQLGALDEYLTAFRTVQGAEAWRNNGSWMRAHPGAVGEAVAERFRLAAAITGEQEAAARDTATALRERLNRIVEHSVLILPTVPGPAPRVAGDGHGVDAVRQATLRMTTPASIGGLPALSIPLLTVTSPLGPAPVGVCLISRPGTDVALVRLGRRIAAAAAGAPNASISSIASTKED